MARLAGWLSSPIVRFPFLLATILVVPSRHRSLVGKLFSLIYRTLWSKQGGNTMRFRQLAMVLAISVTLRAQTTSGTAIRDSTAISVIAQSLSTMGTLASVNLRTLAQGTLTDRNGQVKGLTIETAGVDRVRHDVGPDFRFVSNAGVGFLVLKGTRHALPAWVTEHKRPEHLPSLSLMADYLNPNLQVEYVGLENVNGSPAHHLRLSILPTDTTPAQIEDLTSEFHVYIDRASMLVVRSSVLIVDHSNK